MKFFFFIFTCFMLYQACLPCGDSMDCSALMKVEISAANHQDHEHHSETCTPFCTCSCCATAYHLLYSKTPVYKAVFQFVKYPLFKINFDTEVYASIWQPPKIG